MDESRFYHLSTHALLTSSMAGRSQAEMKSEFYLEDISYCYYSRCYFGAHDRDVTRLMVMLGDHGPPVPQPSVVSESRFRCLSLPISTGRLHGDWPQVAHSITVV